MSSFDKAIIVKAAEKHKQPISNFHEETDSSTRTPYIHTLFLSSNKNPQNNDSAITRTSVVGLNPTYLNIGYFL